MCTGNPAGNYISRIEKTFNNVKIPEFDEPASLFPRQKI
jgi:hypothetical protein